MEAIKISDLSIGDWVRYRDREWIVCSLYQFTEEVGLWRKDSQLCEYVADIEPIPLTPEILEKNGISKTYESDEYAVYKGEGFNVTEYYTELWEFEKHRNRLMIRNVHQLQHALRLAGVEKEIEV